MFPHPRAQRRGAQPGNRNLQEHQHRGCRVMSDGPASWEPKKQGILQEWAQALIATHTVTVLVSY